MKKTLGQFYTTNWDYIFQGLELTHKPRCIVEPFAGCGDLMKFIKHDCVFELYDLDPKVEGCIKRNTLLNPPDYTNKFVLTNPPYLALNKNKDCVNKEIYNKYKVNDLYKAFIKTIIESNACGGLIIIPLNFLSSNRQMDLELRKQFLEKYRIVRVNIFEERVFNDTAYTVCAILFDRCSSSFINTSFNAVVFPEKSEITINLIDLKIGGELHTIELDNSIKVSRATVANKDSPFITNINLKCIDDSNKIGLYIVEKEERAIDTTLKSSGRSYACLVIDFKGRPLSTTEQLKLVDVFNMFLSEKRDKYHSLFLTNFIEKGRKRITFELAFKLCNYLLSTFENHSDLQ
jgi:hypothetical protein